MVRLPLVVYLVIYVLTCLIGSVLLLAGPGDFLALFQLFAGAQAFRLSSAEVFLNVILLVVAPALFALGYEWIVQRQRGWQGNRSLRNGAAESAPVALVLPWLLTSVVAFASVIRGGGLRNVGAWTHYQSWVLARWELFDTLSFLEFVNIYNFLPVTTVLLILKISAGPGTRTRRALLAAGVALPVIAVDLLLFQKKTLLVFILLLALSFVASRDLLQAAKPKRAIVFLSSTAALTYLAYCVMLAGPAFRSRVLSRNPAAPVEKQAGQAGVVPPKARPETSTALETRTAGDGVAAAGEPIVGPTGKLLPRESARARFFRQTTESLFPERWIGVPPETRVSHPTLSRGPALFLYVLVAPFMRTSLPSLLYPVVYPNEIPYYGLDLGLDLVGIGQMPRDTIYVHHRLWPQIQGGSVSVPFQFGLYSQVGLAGALLLSFLAGALLAKLWMWLLCLTSRPEVRAVALSLSLILAIYLAGDSLRNSLLVSYGVFWGGLALALWQPFLERGAVVAPASP